VRRIRGLGHRGEHLRGDGEAQTKARKAVRHAALLPQRPLVVATGCVASLFSGDLSRIASNVVVETDKGRVAQVVAEGLRLDGASHELKTPLSVIIANTGILQPRPRHPPFSRCAGSTAR